MYVWIIVCFINTDVAGRTEKREKYRFWGLVNLTENYQQTYHMCGFQFFLQLAFNVFFRYRHSFTVKRPQQFGDNGENCKTFLCLTDL